MKYFVLPIALLFLVADLSAGEIRCHRDAWGTKVCERDGLRITIKPTIWKETEIRSRDKLIARCKPDIWGDLVCTFEED